MGSVQLLLSAIYDNIWVRRLICFFTVHDKEFVPEEEVERDNLVTGPYWPFTCKRCGLVSDREYYFNLKSPPKSLSTGFSGYSGIGINYEVSYKLPVIPQTQYLGTNLPYWEGYVEHKFKKDHNDTTK